MRHSVLGRGLSALVTMPKRRRVADWRFFHVNEAASVEVFNEPLRHNRRHYLVRVVDALATRWGEAVGVG